MKINVYLVQYERFMTVSKLFWSQKIRNVHPNGQEGLGRFEPGHSNALKLIVENVPGTVRVRSRSKNERITVIIAVNVNF
jgi:hypothetical protein